MLNVLLLYDEGALGELTFAFYVRENFCSLVWEQLNTCVGSGIKKLQCIPGMSFLATKGFLFSVSLSYIFSPRHHHC